MQKSLLRQASDVIAQLRRCGVDPGKGVSHPAIIALAREWSSGCIDNDGFAQCCRNLLILNPSLKEIVVSATILGGTKP